MGTAREGVSETWIVCGSSVTWNWAWVEKTHNKAQQNKAAFIEAYTVMLNHNYT